MGVDIHEWRRLHDIADRNPSAAPAGGAGWHADHRKRHIIAFRKAAAAKKAARLSATDSKKLAYWRYMNA